MTSFLKLTILFSFIILGLTGCETKGGEGNRADIPIFTVSGTYIDAGVVQGLLYETPSQASSTTVDGNFTYNEAEDNEDTNETITFSLGTLSLGSTLGQARITTYTLDENRTECSDESNETINITRLLQTLDSNTTADFIQIDASLATLDLSNFNLSIENNDSVFQDIITEAEILSGISYTIMDEATALIKLHNGVDCP